MVRQSQKILSKQTLQGLAWSTKGKARCKQFVVLPGTSDVSGSRKNKLCPRDTENIEKRYCLVSHYIPNSNRQKKGLKLLELPINDFYRHHHFI